MTVICLEPEAVENGPMNGGTLVVHRAMRGAAVGTEGGDVERWREVSVMVCMMGQGDDPLQNRARFLLATASSVEEIVSSMVSLQACSTGLTSSSAPDAFLGARTSVPAPGTSALFLPHNSCSGCT